MRWLGRIFVTLLLLIAIVALVAWLLLAGGRPQLDGKIALRGLVAPVTITRDARGTPTITARNRNDAAYALGFLHGQERFFQMDLLRRTAAGELSELVGKAALKTDEKHRIHRFRALAETELMQLPASEHVLLDAYTRGVNAGLHSLDVRPWAYLLLRATPQKWRAEDSLLVIDAMFLDLNQQGENKRELNLKRLAAAMQSNLYFFLIAPDPRWQAPLTGAIDDSLHQAMCLSVFPCEGSPPVPAPVKPQAAGFQLDDAQLAEGARAVHAATLADSGIGSNGFAVSGALTGTGALLANDPHLGLRVPDIWYRARMRWPDPIAPNQTLDLNGVTLPGTPALVIGSNGHVAWGFTNSEGDWMDWVRVIRDPKDPSRYKTADGWAKIVRHDEIIRVHGEPDHHFTVEDTIWGPIAAKDVDGTPLALAWIAQWPRALNLNLVKLESVRSVQDALGWAPLIGIPPQNLVVADSHGDIGWSIAGSAIPLRAGFDPSLPADWSKPDTGWTGFASPSQDPHILNPGNHRIWTANQRLVDDDALKLLGNGGYDQGARAQQIRDDLLARQHFVPEDMLNVQLDNRALFLARWQKLLLKVLGGCDPGSSHGHVPAGMSASCTRLLALKPFVEHWQERAAADSVGYRIVRKFHDRVREDVLAPYAAQAKKKFPDFEWPSAEIGEGAVWMLVTHTQQPPRLLDPHYKDWNALLLHSATEVADDLAKIPGPLSQRTWGEFNTARIHHPLAVALPSWLAKFVDMPPDPLPGDRDMPRVLHPDFGASMRLDVSPGDEAHGILEMPAGQASNPLTPYFGAGHEDWVHGTPTPLLPGPAKYRITLVPATH